MGDFLTDHELDFLRKKADAAIAALGPWPSTEEDEALIYDANPRRIRAMLDEINVARGGQG